MLYMKAAQGSMSTSSPTTFCAHTNAHTPKLAMAFSARLSGKQKWCLKAECQTSLYFMENQKVRVLPSAACGLVSLYSVILLDSEEE